MEDIFQDVYNEIIIQLVLWLQLLLSDGRKFYGKQFNGRYFWTNTTSLRVLLEYFCLVCITTGIDEYFM